MNRPAHPPRVLLLALILPGATADGFTIRTSKDSVTRIGSFRTARDATIAAGTRAFGAGE
jgi:hypothetical protein